MKKCCIILAVLLLLPLLCCCAAPAPTVYSAGFASAELTVPDLQSSYIAGYRNGSHPTGVLDRQMLSALWLDDGATSLLLISVDCIGLDSGSIGRIRQTLQSFARKTGCDSINVISTHTHAGVDTLGLWGPVAINGKNSQLVEDIIVKAVQCAAAAYEDRTAGQLLYSATPTDMLQRDSRDPQVYDNNLYQLRFSPDDPAANGIRLISYAAHAEALRGDNLLISADYPGVIRSTVKEATGDDIMYVPGAIGGLIMTRKLEEQDMVSNLQKTGQRLAEYVLSPAQETPVEPGIRISRQEFTTPLENTLFIYYKFLGILGSKVSSSLSGYRLHTEVSAIQLGDVTLALVPGELFPELVYGTGSPEDPEALADIAERYGAQKLMVIGLANDEIGYIVPPSDFLLNEDAPYVVEAEDHYEETNSLGPGCAADLAAAFEQAVKRLK